MNMQPQPPPQPLAVPRTGMFWGRAIRPTNHVVRLNDQLVPADIFRQRFTADILSCHDLLARGDVIAKNYDPPWINKPRLVRAMSGGDGGFGGGAAAGGLRAPYPNHSQLGATNQPPNPQGPQIRPQHPQSGHQGPTGNHGHITIAGHPSQAPLIQGNQPITSNTQVGPGNSPAPQGPHDLPQTSPQTGGPLNLPSSVPGSSMMFQHTSNSPQQGGHQPPNGPPFFANNASNSHLTGQRQIPIQAPMGNMQVLSMYQYGNAPPHNLFMPIPSRPHNSGMVPVMSVRQDGSNPGYYQAYPAVYFQQNQGKTADRKQEKREKKVLSIVDPSTGEDVLQNMQTLDNEGRSPSRSGNDSARNTPAPNPHPVVQEFAVKMASLSYTPSENETVDTERTNNTSEINSNVIRSNSDNSRQLSDTVDNLNNVSTNNSDSVNTVTDNNGDITDSSKFISNCASESKEVCAEVPQLQPPHGPHQGRMQVPVQRVPHQPMGQPPPQRQRSPVPQKPMVLHPQSSPPNMVNMPPMNAPHPHMGMQPPQFMNHNQQPPPQQMNPMPHQGVIPTHQPPPPVNMKTNPPPQNLNQQQSSPPAGPPMQSMPPQVIEEMAKNKGQKNMPPPGLVPKPVHTPNQVGHSGQPMQISPPSQPSMSQAQSNNVQVVSNQGPKMAHQGPPSGHMQAQSVEEANKTKGQKNVPQTGYGPKNPRAPGQPEAMVNQQPPPIVQASQPPNMSQPPPQAPLMSQPPPQIHPPQSQQPPRNKSPMVQHQGPPPKQAMSKPMMNQPPPQTTQTVHQAPPSGGKSPQASKESTPEPRNMQNKFMPVRRGKGPASVSPPRIQAQRETTPVVNNEVEERPAPHPIEEASMQRPSQPPSKEPSLEPKQVSREPSLPPNRELSTPNRDGITPSPKPQEVKEIPKVVAPPSETPSPVTEKPQTWPTQTNSTVNHNHKEPEEEPVVNNEEQESSLKPSQVLNYDYKDDQWSPLNQAGKKQYDRNFLLNLQNNPLSLKRPESLPNLEVVLNDVPSFNKSNDSRIFLPNNLSNMHDIFAPNYVKGTRPTGKKQIGNRPSFSGKNPVKIIPPLIRASADFKKLQISDNAWRPRVKEGNANTNKEDAAKEEILKSMRGILNKLTPDNFNRLLENIKELKISSSEAVLRGVVDLIFEKAVDEQSFSTTYALLCSQLHNHMNGGSKQHSKDRDKENKDKDFRSLIIKKCQTEFETDNLEEMKIKWDKELAAETDPSKKEQLAADHEYLEMRLRKRSVGNVRFIGELYKVKMLRFGLMITIINSLLRKSDSESLECLCKLLTTIGAPLQKDAEYEKKMLDQFQNCFVQMRNIIDSKKTSSRVRFLMMDVIDLKENRWVPRRVDNAPKTKAEVHEEVRKEEEREAALTAAASVRRNDGGYKRNQRDHRPMGEDGWSTIQSSSTKKYTFDSTRLKNNSNFNFSKDNLSELTFGNPFQSNWQHGSSGGQSSSSQEHGGMSYSNKFNVLSDNVDEKRSMYNTPRMGHQAGSRIMSGGSKSMPPPSSSEKESALSAVRKMHGQDSSRMMNRSRETSLKREPSNELNGDPKMDEETAEKCTKAIVEEFIVAEDYKEALTCVMEKFHSNTIFLFVRSSVEWVLDKNTKKRHMVGLLFHRLIKENILLKKQFSEGNKDIFEMLEDFLIDIPNTCEYYGEILAPLFEDKVYTIEAMYDFVSSANDLSIKLFANILKRATLILSPDTVWAMWKSSKLDWASILPNEENPEQFLKKYDLGYLLSSAPCNKGDRELDMKAFKQTLLKMLCTEEMNEIFKWIDATVPKESRNNQFIRALCAALVDSCIPHTDGGQTMKIGNEFKEQLTNRLDVLGKYVDDNPEFERQIIYELQALYVNYCHPQNFLENLFTIFSDKDILSEEVILEWASSTNAEAQNAKGLCLMTLRKFLEILKESSADT